MSADASHDDDFEAALRRLWLRGQQGDEAAYREALARMAGRLRRYFAGRLRALPDDVEDLVQETLIALHLKRGTWDPGLPVGSWMYAIARHKLVDLFRRRGRREALEDPLDEAQACAQAPVHEPSAARDLDVLLDQLPAAQRRAIALTKLQGLSVQEASQSSGVSVSALKVQVHRGMKRLALLVRSAS